MMKNETCIDSASPKKRGTDTNYKKLVSVPNYRMLRYKRFAVAFSYPDEKFLKFFPELESEKEALALEYDRLFRSSQVWLYGAEHIAENEFQRAKILADINGFYRAFGLETNKDRPDSLPCELEFMHYLIFKESHAKKMKDPRDSKEKASISVDAEKKFFTEHLYPACENIARKIITQAKDKFYIGIAEELLQFLKAELAFFKGN